MLLRSFISISKLLAALFCLGAPWYFGDLYLQTVSAYKPDLDRLMRGMSQSMKGRSVLIGECTISPLDALHQFGRHPEMAVFGFGGSNIKEWYYLIKNNRERFEEADRILIASVHADKLSYLHNTYTSFLPFLMTWRDIFDYAITEKKISHAEMLRFYLAKTFVTYSASQVMRYRVLDQLLPGYRAWYDERNKLVGARRKLLEAKDASYVQDINTATDPEEYIRRIVALTDGMKPRFLYVLNPRSSWMTTDDFKRQRATLLGDCERHGFPCLDLSGALPDSDFSRSGDGLHIEPEASRALFWTKIQEEIRRRGLDKPKGRATAGATGGG